MPNITPTTSLPRATGLEGPYFSSKRDRHVDLNGKASIGDVLLSCANLSFLWERSFNALQGKPDYDQFTSVESLQASAPRDLMALAANRSLAQVQFVDNDAWGARIADAFKSMDAAGRSHQSFQVLTPNHGMSVGLRTKTRHDARCYVAKFYDPNLTATHQRAHAGNPDAFARLTAHDFFVESPDDMATYMMDADSGSVVFLGDVLPGHAQQAVRIEHLDSRTLFHLLDLGLAEGIVRYAERLEERQLDRRQLAELLDVKSDSGCPGLALAMSHGHGDAVRAYGAMLVRAGLDTADTTGLLAGIGDIDAAPGLFRAMQDDRADAIRAWGEVFLRCKLGVQERARLLDARRADGTTGLAMAMWWNNADAILEYGKLLLASGLPIGELLPLMESTASNGASALYGALEQGNADAIRAYGTVLMASPTDPSQRTRLLAATGPGGKPGLAAALRGNRTRALQAYRDVLADAGLDPLQLRELLGMTGDHVPAILAALPHAQPAARRVYFDAWRTLQARPA